MARGRSEIIHGGCAARDSELPPRHVYRASRAPFILDLFRAWTAIEHAAQPAPSSARANSVLGGECEPSFRKCAPRARSVIHCGSVVGVVIHRPAARCIRRPGTPPDGDNESSRNVLSVITTALRPLR